MCSAIAQGSSRLPAILGGTPLFDDPIYVTRPRVPSPERLAERLARVLESRRLTNDGPCVRQLEEELRTRLGTSFCVATANATIGLQLALRVLELEGEVITSPFTFPATVHAIEWNGLTPVFCDIDPKSYNLDPVRVAELVTERTSALLPIHVFGNPCDVEAFERIGQQQNLRVLYDAAHAFGVEHAGRPISAFGDLSVHSFHATKLFHTAEGGAIVGPQAERREPVALLRNFGIVNQNEVRGVGLNGKMSELHAALGIEVLTLIDDEIDRRAAVASRYLETLGTTSGIGFQQFAANSTSNHGYFSIEVDEEAFGLTRDELHRALLAENVVSRKYFHPLACDNPAYRGLPSAAPERLPNACRLASRILCLPIYGELPLDHVDAIAACIVDLGRDPQRARAALGSESS
jgi:dTDP-4-amino-4,6-dideoxygalactose transaminase